MTKNHPLLDEIRALRPTDDDGWARSTDGQRVLARALAAPAAQSTGRRTSRRLLIGGVASAGLMLAGGTAAAVVVLQADSPTQAGCYTSLSPTADTTEASAALVAEVGATEACRRTWTAVGEDVDAGNPVSCVNSAGGRGVFPAPVGIDRKSVV